MIYPTIYLAHFGINLYMSEVRAQHAANTIITLHITLIGVGIPSGESMMIAGPIKI